MLGKDYIPSKMDKNKRFRDYYEKIVSSIAKNSNKLLTHVTKTRC